MLNVLIKSRSLTEMNAVRSIATRGTISTRCSEAMSSSSAGMTDVLREAGSAIYYYFVWRANYEHLFDEVNVNVTTPAPSAQDA